MGLMFPRLARNFIKNGYYPTDAATIERSLNAIVPAQAERGVIKILDNCCGEGTALAECQHYLMSQTSAKVESFGVEYDKQRAWHSKSLLNTCIHGDINDCVFGARQFGLAWLNPPYGDLVSDSDHLNREGGRGRLEKQFYRRTVATLQHGGIMILIIPHYSLDKELSEWISKHFEKVKVFRAAEEQFKQVVIFGKRCKVNKSDKNIRETLRDIGFKKIIPEELSDEWLDEQYIVPIARQSEFKFYHVKMDISQLADEICNKKTLWNRFDILFNKGVADFSRPLRKLSDWHLALALAAGQVSGIVESNDGRIFVIKGDTFKDKINKVETSIRDDGSVAETRISTDIFVPSIKAIDFTPESQTFGQILTIK